MKFNLISQSVSRFAVGAIHELPRQNQHELPRQNQHELPRQNQHELPRQIATATATNR